MKSSLSLLSLALFALSLSACMHNRTDDYVNAENVAPLKTPPGIQSPSVKDSYPIPQKSSAEVVPAPSLIPPGLTADEEAAKIALAKQKEEAKNAKETKENNTDSAAQS